VAPTSKRVKPRQRTKPVSTNEVDCQCLAGPPIEALLNTRSGWSIGFIEDPTSDDLREASGYCCTATGREGKRRLGVKDEQELLAAATEQIPQKADQIAASQ
jgi:hypothetical protein